MPPGKRPGRPPDPRVEAEAIAATLRVYAEKGWSGLSFDVVAREARIGKGALYRRWPGREALLIDALDRSMLPIAVACGSFEADLEAFALQWVTWYSDRFRGLALMRIWADAQTNPGLGQRYDEVLIAPRRRALAQLLRRAVERGELTDLEVGETVIDVLLGAMQTHWQFARRDSSDELGRRFVDYLRQLIELLCAGAFAPEHRSERGGQAAVDGDDLAGDERGGVAGQEYHGPGDFLGPAPAAKRGP